MASQFKNGRCAASSGSLCRLRRLRRRADCRDVRPSFGRARLRTPAGPPCLHTHGVAAPLDAPAPHFPGRRGGGSPGVGWAGEEGGGGGWTAATAPNSKFSPFSGLPRNVGFGRGGGSEPTCVGRASGPGQTRRRSAACPDRQTKPWFSTTKYSAGLGRRSDIQ